MVEKGIRGGICHAIHRYAKANNKYMKNYDKNKESSYIPVFRCKHFFTGFKWNNNMLNFNEDFIKSYDEDNDKGYVFEVDDE